MSEKKIINTMGVGNCGGRCILQAHVEDGKIVKMMTEKPEECSGQVPLTACMRGLQAHKTFFAEERLTHPLRRIGKRGEGRFEQITWEEALDQIASEWVRIRDTYGPGSRFVTYATGNEGVMRGDSAMRRLLNLDHGSLEYYNNYSAGCIAPVTKLMYGTGETGNNPALWLESELIILWGHNPFETQFDRTMYYLREARKKGIPIVVVDPRQSDTILALSAEWIPIRPATDAAMMDAMAYVIWQEQLQDQEFLDRCCQGFDEAHMPDGIDPTECYLDYLMGKKDGILKTPEWAEQITGVSADLIRNLAIRYGKARAAALIQGYGGQRHSCGEQIVRGGILLACMTGNVGIPGGWASGLGNFSCHEVPEFPEGDNPYQPKIPVYLWTDAIVRGTELTGLDGIKNADHLDSNIKMIFSIASNTLINQHGDINRTRAILEDTGKCEFIVCCDLFMTSSAKYADIVLPAASVFETENITFPWKYRDILGFANQIVCPVGESRPEYDWIRELASRLGLEKEFSLGRTGSEWLEALYEDLRTRETELPEYESFKEAAVYRYQSAHKSEVAFEKERSDPKKYPFPTESGKIEIFSRKIYETEYPEPVPAIPEYIPPTEGPQDPKTKKYPLQLIGWHPRHRCHSIHYTNQELRRRKPQELWMNQVDAKERGLTEGQTVRVWNDRGSMEVPVHVTDRIMKGVTALAAGAWYDPDSNGVDKAGSINVLTSHYMTAFARGNAQHSNLVQAEAITKGEVKK